MIVECAVAMVCGVCQSALWTDVGHFFLRRMLVNSAVAKFDTYMSDFIAPRQLVYLMRPVTVIACFPLSHISDRPFVADNDTHREETTGRPFIG